MPAHPPPPTLDALLAHADWLHRLARQLARDAHEGADVAQDALLSALRAPPRDGANVRGYLARAVRNLLALRRRQQPRAARRERVHGAAAPTFAESAADAAARAELCQLLGKLVLALPEPQRALVLLHHFEGLDVGDVAVRAGITGDAVRAHLRRARDALRTRLGADGDPRIARAFAGLLATTPMLTTGITMTTTGKSLAIAAAAVAALLLLSPWNGDAAAPQPDARRVAATLEGAVTPAPKQRDAERDRAPADLRERPAAAGTGSLTLQVRWSDGTPAARMRVVVRPDLADRIAVQHTVTGADGVARLDGLPPARGAVNVENRGGASFTIDAGATCAVDVQLRAGVTVRGVVVDANGNPLPGARVWLSRDGGAEEGLELDVVARDGTFVLRDVACGGDGCYLAALAPGARVSTLTPVLGDPGSTQHVRIELREPGVALDGRVLLPDGRPAARARVLAGDAQSRPWWREAVWRVSRPALEARCDDDGAFHFDGLEPDAELPLWVRAEGTATWCRRVRTVAGGAGTVQVQLQRGATCGGTVTDAAGAGVDGVEVYAKAASPGDPRRDERLLLGPAWAWQVARTGAAGEYRIQHVAAGAVSLVALRRDPPARATADVVAADGATLTWDPQLTRGTTIRGSVVDELGAPLAGWEVRGRGEAQGGGERQGAERSVPTSADGSFELPDCVGDHWNLAAYGPGRLGWSSAASALGVRSGSSDVRIVVPRARIPDAAITGTADRGRVADGRLLVRLLRDDDAFALQNALAEENGAFRLGLVPAGRYRLSLATTTGRSAPWTAWITLRRGETLDVGTLRFGPTGDLAATVTAGDGSPLDDLACHVIDTVEGFDVPIAAGRSVGGELRVSGMLEAGDYRLRVVDPRHPACEVPVAITANAETRVAMRVEPAVECSLRLVSARAGGEVTCSLRWTRDGVRGLQEHRTVNAREARTLSRWLLPGAYEVEATDEVGTRTTSRFTVRAGVVPHPPIVVQLP